MSEFHSENNEAISAQKVSCFGIYKHTFDGEIHSANGIGGKKVDALITVFRDGSTRVNCLLAYMDENRGCLCKAMTRNQKGEIPVDDYPTCVYSSKAELGK